jgi:hypothetical protein
LCAAQILLPQGSARCNCKGGKIRAAEARKRLLTAVYHSLRDPSVIRYRSSPRDRTAHSGWSSNCGEGFSKSARLYNQAFQNLTSCEARRLGLAASPHFSLVKWYLDCVSDRGEVAILYSARVRWRGIGLAYSNLIYTDGAAAESASSMRSLKIRRDGQQILVASPQLDAQGQWTARARPVERTVYACESGSVVWNCLQPAASVSLSVREKKLAGAGYAECLTLTLPPWKLPLRHLQWGRFVSDHDAPNPDALTPDSPTPEALTWIDWEGPYGTSLVVHNGASHDGASISATEVAWRGGKLRMEEPLTLRTGRLGSTILPAAPALSKICPRSLFNVEEKKWRSRGILETPDHQSRGWVIHETVDWSSD